MGVFIKTMKLNILVVCVQHEIINFLMMIKAKKETKRICRISIIVFVALSNQYHWRYNINKQ